jgi:hypothetical protein
VIYRDRELSPIAEEGPAERIIDYRIVSYRCGGSPLVLGEELMLVTALDSTSDTVNALVGLAVREALEGSLGSLVLLLEEIVVFEAHLAVPGGVDVPGSGGLEKAGEPRPAEDEGGERVLHFESRRSN